MIEKQPRWYHHLMLPWQGQMAVIVVTMLVAMVQYAIYDMLEEDIVKFEGQCEVIIGPEVADNVVYKGTKMKCGDESVSMRQFESSYLYEVLTHNREPVIMCTKTVSEYLNETNWDCVMDPEETKEQT